MRWTERSYLRAITAQFIDVFSNETALGNGWCGKKCIAGIGSPERRCSVEKNNRAGGLRAFVGHLDLGFALFSRRPNYSASLCGIAIAMVLNRNETGAHEVSVENSHGFNSIKTFLWFIERHPPFMRRQHGSPISDGLDRTVVFRCNYDGMGVDHAQETHMAEENMSVFTVRLPACHWISVS